jgi:protein CpxP
MRKVTAAVMASTLAFSAFSQAAVAIISDNDKRAQRSTVAKAICLTA